MLVVVVMRLGPGLDPGLRLGVSACGGGGHVMEAGGRMRVMCHGGLSWFRSRTDVADARRSGHAPRTGPRTSGYTRVGCHRPLSFPVTARAVERRHAAKFCSV